MHEFHDSEFIVCSCELIEPILDTRKDTIRCCLCRQAKENTIQLFLCHQFFCCRQCSLCFATTHRCFQNKNTRIRCISNRIKDFLLKRARWKIKTFPIVFPYIRYTHHFCRLNGIFLSPCHHAMLQPLFYRSRLIFFQRD